MHSDIFTSSAPSKPQQPRMVGGAPSRLGYDVWQSNDRRSHSLHCEMIEARPSGAKAALVAWSAEAVKSQWVQSEADRAIQEGNVVQLAWRRKFG